MAKETTERHNAAALNHIAAELEDHAASLKAAAVLLSVEPEIRQIDVRFENSRKVGLEYIRNWVKAAKDAAFDARVELAQKHAKSDGVRSARGGDTPVKKA
jgi:hypothetical protein